MIIKICSFIYIYKKTYINLCICNIIYNISIYIYIYIYIKENLNIIYINKHCISHALHYNINKVRSVACCAHAMSEVMGSQTHPSTNDLNLFSKGKGWNPTSTSHSTQSLNLFLTVRGGIPHRPATALKKPAHRPFSRCRRNIFQKG